MKKPIATLFLRGKSSSFAYTVIIFLLISVSCKTAKCPICHLENDIIYNIKLDDNAADKYNGKSEIITFFTPIPLKGSGRKFDLHVVDCEDSDAYLLEDGEGKLRFFNDNKVVVDTVDIIRVTKNSDSDILPEVFPISSLIIKAEEEKLDLCRRARNRVKFELRGMLGSRLDYSDYIPVPGAEPISKKLFGFGEEGTKLVLGSEFSLLAPIYTVNNKHRFHLGIMTGFWPVDGGSFIPIAIHPRFTFNDVASPLSGKCNTIYLFGDVGTAYDLSGSASKFYSKTSGLNSYFFDGGIGFDLWKTKGMDLSFDIGLRQTVLAFADEGSGQELLDCLAENDIPYSDFNKRQAAQIFIRFGLTF